MDESFEPLIPYGFFSEGFLDLNDSSLVIHYDPRCIIERPGLPDHSLLSDRSSNHSIPARGSRMPDFVHVSNLELKSTFQLLFFQLSNGLAINCVEDATSDQTCFLVKIFDSKV